MSEHPLIYLLEVGPFVFGVREVKGEEHLSRAWRLEVSFPLLADAMGADPAAFDPDVVIKQQAVLKLKRKDDVQRALQGIVTEATLSASISGVPEVHLVLEPRLSLLKHRRDMRIHRNMTVPEIVTEVCEALGVTIDNRLQSSYPNRPYCVQWRESDYDYVMRLLEDEGIFYFFAAGDTMVLGDASSAYEVTPGAAALPFRHDAAASMNYDAVHRIGSRAAITAGKVSLRDWNTEHPSLDMDVSAATAVPFGPEWYDYPGEYEEPAEGRRKVELHAEAFDRAAAAMTGRTSCARIYPGSTFTLLDPPLGVEGGALVVRKVVHQWNVTVEGFESAFEADKEEVVYRPPRVTFVPRIYNPHTGIVCTDGSDIQCDHFGRVKVHFHWDRLRPYDDDCSHWVPVLQDNTGGSSAIPRKDWEMVVHFMEGDPDRPIVVGRVYNGDDVFREKLPYAKDRSSLTSATSPTRDTANEIRFEDAAGMQRIFQRAPKDMNLRVAGHQTARVGSSNTRVIENDESVQIGGDADWDIGGRMELSVGNNQRWSVGGDRIMNIGKGDMNGIGIDHELTIGGNYDIEVFNDVNFGSDNLKEELNGDVTQKYKQKHTTEIGGEMTLTIGGDLKQTCKSGKSEQNTKDRTEEVGAGHSIKAEREIQWRCDKLRTIAVAGSLEAQCPKHLTLTGAERFRMQSKTAEWTADGELYLIVSDGPAGESGTNESWISMKNGVLEVKAVENVTFFHGSAADFAATISKQDGGKG
ncbi:MAG TPA: type VI secretion system tip protein VgrG [Sorangium sp.]|nr:type VI secretion system tip protein VgrG [Sorangium sp.]